MDTPKLGRQRDIAPAGAATNSPLMNTPAAEEGEAGDAGGPLPRELLVKVLERVVPPSFRLRSCALVCRAWRDAAAAATSKVMVGGFSFPAPRLDCLCRWLSGRGQHTTSLMLPAVGTLGAPFHPGQLPCPELKSLELFRCHLQLTTAPGAAAPALSSLSSLTSLTLGGAADFYAFSTGGGGSNTYVGAPECFRELTQLTGLQHLCVSAPKQTPAEKVLQGRHRMEFPAGVLSRLVHLARLELAFFAVTPAALENLNLLSGLQHLNFGSIDPEEEEFDPIFGDYDFGDDEEDEQGAMPPATLAGVSGLQHLTSLRVPGAGVVLGSSRAPGLSTLTSLRSLDMENGAGLQPRALSHLTALEKLRLWDAPLVSGGTNSVALLSVLPRLQQLKELCLLNALDDTAPPAMYSALVASNKLEELMLTGCQLPQGAWAAMFGGRGQVPALRRITMNDYIRISGGSCGVHTAELRALAMYCPALKSLTVRGSVDPAADWSVLQPLPLQDMMVQEISDDAAAGLAQITSLEMLTITWPNSVTREGLAHFTALRQLEHLEVCDGGVCFDGPYNLKWSFMSNAPRRSPPDVWQQVQAYLQGPSAFISNQLAPEGDSPPGWERHLAELRAHGLC